MYCKNCGNELNDVQAICLKCGVEVGKGKGFCPNCGKAVAEEAVFCVNCGISLKEEEPKAPVSPEIKTTGIAFRSLATCIILSLVTCGIYSIYWFVCLTNDMNALAGKHSDTSGGMAFLLGLLTCGIYLYFWAYKIGEKRDFIAKENGSSNILYLILTFFGLSIVVYCLAQDAINKAVSKS